MRTVKALVTAIVRNVKCEVQDALDDLYGLNKRTFLDSYGVQINLNLTITEKSTANPNAVWTPASPATAVFALAGGVNLSSEATRTDKLGMYYTVAQLRHLGRCVPEARGGPYLLHSDLKLNEWLVDAVTAGHTGGVNYKQNVASGAFKDGILSHEVKFVVSTGGDITPGWKLTRVAINPSGPFLSANRERSHDLLITFGPTELVTDKNNRVVRRGPSRAASDSALASDIGVSVGNALRNQLRQ